MENQKIEIQYETLPQSLNKLDICDQCEKLKMVAYPEVLGIFVSNKSCFCESCRHRKRPILSSIPNKKKMDPTCCEEKVEVFIQSIVTYYFSAKNDGILASRIILDF